MRHSTTPKENGELDRHYKMIAEGRFESNPKCDDCIVGHVGHDCHESYLTYKTKDFEDINKHDVTKFSYCPICGRKL